MPILTGIKYETIQNIVEPLLAAQMVEIDGNRIIPVEPIDKAVENFVDSFTTPGGREEARKITPRAVMNYLWSKGFIEGAIYSTSEHAEVFGYVPFNDQRPRTRADVEEAIAHPFER